MSEMTLCIMGRDQVLASWCIKNKGQFQVSHIKKRGEAFGEITESSSDVINKHLPWLVEHRLHFQIFAVLNELQKPLLIAGRFSEEKKPIKCKS